MILNLYNKLRNDLIESNLPVGTLYFVLKDLTKEIENLFSQIVQEEQKDAQEIKNKINEKFQEAQTNLNQKKENEKESGQE